MVTSRQCSLPMIITIVKTLEWVWIQCMNWHCTLSIGKIRYGSCSGRCWRHRDTIFRTLEKQKNMLFNIDIFVLYKILTIIILIQKYGACVFFISWYGKQEVNNKFYIRLAPMDSCKTRSFGVDLYNGNSTF